jgi:hypothetical protein
MATYQSQARDKLTFVKVSGNGLEVYYGFKTIDLTNGSGVGQDDLAALGHLPGDALPDGSLYFLRANSPKPARAKKTLKKNPTVSEKGSTSTFCAYGKEKDARIAGWDITKGRRGVSLKANARFTTAIAEISNGLLYVYPLNTATFNSYKDVLGLKSPAEITTEAERVKLVRGSSIPYPGKAVLDLGNGKTVTSFFSHDKISSLIENNWTVLSEERL